MQIKKSRSSSDSEPFFTCQRVLVFAKLRISSSLVGRLSRPSQMFQG